MGLCLLTVLAFFIISQYLLFICLKAFIASNMCIESTMMI